METVLSPKSAWLAFLFLVPCLGAWEWFWRSEGWPARLDDNKHLYAETRAKVDHLGSDDYVLIGSSRVLFDFQLDEWESVTGHRPVQLAVAGGSPMPVFQDLVDNSDFKGTIIFGVTPGLFFRAVGPGIGPWDHSADWIRHYHNRTYAQRFTHWVGKPIQHTLACLENDEDSFDNDLDLKTLINRIPLKGRVSVDPFFPWFQYLDDDRNLTMFEKVTEDTAYAGMIQRTWKFFVTSGPPRDSMDRIESRDKVLELLTPYLERFKARGGRVIFVRCPSGDWLRNAERFGFPRTAYWDVLLERTGLPGYHFEDYPFLNQYTTPEWSHLATPDAKQFTLDIARLMQQDGVIKQDIGND